jgi:hypothetical protein
LLTRAVHNHDGPSALLRPPDGCGARSVSDRSSYDDIRLEAVQAIPENAGDFSRRQTSDIPFAEQLEPGSAFKLLELSFGEVVVGPSRSNFEYRQPASVQGGDLRESF